jgi:hypothetical protein
MVINKRIGKWIKLACEISENLVHEEDKYERAFLVWNDEENS